MLTDALTGALTHDYEEDAIRAERAARQTDDHEVSPAPFFSPENQVRLRRSIAQMEATGGTVRETPRDDQSLD